MSGKKKEKDPGDYKDVIGDQHLQTDEWKKESRRSSFHEGRQYDTTRLSKALGARFGL